MKYCYLIICCFVVLATRGQDSSMFVSWNKLMSAFVKRATTFENVTLSVARITPVDTSIITEIIEKKIELECILGFSDKLDSNFLQNVEGENKKSIASFSKVMDILLSKPAPVSQQELSDFQKKLMSAENNIFIAKKQYNALMLVRNRKDLLYP